jgi:SAM-dependent methyltransferase
MVNAVSGMANCPGCGRNKTFQFYTISAVPVQSMLLLDSTAEAKAVPTGDVVLHVCHDCGFIFNPRFDPASQEFSPRYEASQGFSATFSSFHERLADSLIERYGLNGKRVIEIGCGQGEFLQLLCNRGQNEGLGFDPVFDACRSPLSDTDQVTVIADYFDDRYMDSKADLFCCKMSLEHIADPRALLSTLQRTIGSQSDTPVFFQIPNALPILEQVEFWDIYYEHCCYYTPGTLARLFRNCGFTVVDLWTDYRDQYLMIDARVGTDDTTHPLEEEPDVVVALTNDFVSKVQVTTNNWKQTLAEVHHRGKRAALWGSGSKAVGFLTTLDLHDEVSCVVDINPFRQGKYMASTGQPIIAPQDLYQFQPELVIIMNPIYRDEIERNLEQLGLVARIVTVAGA